MVSHDRPVYQEEHAAQLIMARRRRSPPKGRIHLRRSVDRPFAFPLQSDGGPYIRELRLCGPCNMLPTIEELFLMNMNDIGYFEPMISYGLVWHPCWISISQRKSPPRGLRHGNTNGPTYICAPCGWEINQHFDHFRHSSATFAWCCSSPLRRV
jgi:hypothetical protein